MTALVYKINKDEDGKNTIAVWTGEKLEVADESHVNYEAIVAGALEEDPTVLELFDPTPQIADYFSKVTERISVANGRVYFDRDALEESAFTEQLLRALEEGDTTNWGALANFYEKVATNPCEHSRNQLFDWLQKYPTFTITEDGDLICYKGVHQNLLSGSSGEAIVDGRRITGQIPNAIGSVVEMPRSEVNHDPSRGCSVGLHVATPTFAKGFLSQGKTLAVIVNPRDVVSVPTDANSEKMRVCRYTVKEIIKEAYRTVTLPSAEKPALKAGTPALKKGTITVNKQSPLDTAPKRVREGLAKRIARGESTKDVLGWLATKGIVTGKDSLRRYKQRHGY